MSLTLCQKNNSLKKSLFLIFILIISSNLFAQQTKTAAIKQTVDTLFEAMRKGDSTLLRSVFSKDLILQSISNDKTGKAVLTTEKADGFVKAIGTAHTGVYDERIVFGDIKIDGDLPSLGYL